MLFIFNDPLLVGHDAANGGESYSSELWIRFPELSSSNHVYSTKLEFNIMKTSKIGVEEEDDDDDDDDDDAWMTLIIYEW